MRDPFLPMQQANFGGNIIERNAQCQSMKPKQIRVKKSFQMFLFQAQIVHNTRFLFLFFSLPFSHLLASSSSMAILCSVSHDQSTHITYYVR